MKRMSLKDFYNQLGEMPSAGVTVFMDACFSGSKRGDGMLASARGVAIKAKPQAPQGKMVVFSAAQGDETAYPYKEKEHGLFTYYLLKKLKETGGNVSLGELGEFITDQVSRKSIVANGKSQTPTIVSSGAIGDSWKSMKLHRLSEGVPKSMCTDCRKYAYYFPIQASGLSLTVSLRSWK